MDRFDRSSRARRRGALIALALVGTLLPALPAGTVAAEGSGSTTQYQPTQGRISAGLHHACAVLDSGDVTCWGQGAQGALGYGNTANIGDTETVAQNPVGGGLVALPGGAKATAVAAGNSSTCALLATGRVTCWGDGAHGQLGFGNTADIGDTETPAQNPVNGGIVPLPGNALATEIGAGNGFACALLAGGTVTCWGSGAAGELGYGNTADIGDTETPAQNPVNGGIVPLPAGRSAVRIAVGGGSVCALLDDGTVTCWGYGADGRLGYGNTANIGDTETPAQNPANGGIVRLTNAAGVTAAAISVGGSSACAVLSTQQLVCWGDAGLGQLGYGNTADIGDTETPADNPVGGGIVAVPAPPGGAAGSALVVSVDVGAYQTCALLTTHEVACWGAGAGGELGYGNTANIGDTKTPAQNNVNGGIVAQGRPTVAVTAGGFFSCALLQGGTLDCWGLAADGQLGYGNTENIGDDETPAQNPVNNGDVPLPGGQVITQLYVPITPARVLDTRAGGTTIDGKAAGGGPIQAGTELYLNIAGRAGVPYDSTSVTMNVAVTNAVADGFHRAPVRRSAA